MNIEGETVVCPNCQNSCNADDHMKRGHFIVFPLKSQLKGIMEQNELLSQLTNKSGATHSSPMTDITDCVLYKKFLQNNEAQS